MGQTGKSTLFSGHERLVQQTIETGHSETKIHPSKQITLAYVPSPKISSRNQASYLESEPLFFVCPESCGAYMDRQVHRCEGRILGLQRHSHPNLWSPRHVL